MLDRLAKAAEAEAAKHMEDGTGAIFEDAWPEVVRAVLREMREPGEVMKNVASYNPTAEYGPMLDRLAKAAEEAAEYDWPLYADDSPSDHTVTNWPEIVRAVFREMSEAVDNEIAAYPDDPLALKEAMGNDTGALRELLRKFARSRVIDTILEDK